MIEPHGFMEGLMFRIDGPMNFRLVVQPLVALLYGIRDGRADAGSSAPAYFWALLTDAEHRRQMIEGGWRSIGKVLVIAIILDLVFQYLTFSSIRLAGAVVVGIVLALMPYLVLRGLVNRVLHTRQSRSGPPRQ